MRYAFLLAFVHRLLLRQTGGALYFKRTVDAGVLEHALLFDMNNFIDDRIEEVAVVRDQDQRALIALQPFFQPDNGIEIEVLDLDHDLGDFANQGGDAIKLLDWLVERETFYPVEIHTANPVGRANMESVLARYWGEEYW